MLGKCLQQAKNPLRTSSTEELLKEQRFRPPVTLCPLLYYHRAISNFVTDTTSTTAEASNSTPETREKKCANCHTLETTDLALKPCNKCQTTLYCSRDCQKAGWKHHKKECPSLAQTYAQTHEPKMAVTRAPPKTGRAGKGIGKWEYDT